MAYCKRCACGYLNVYEHAGGGPMRCQKDGRPLRNVTEAVFTGQPEFIDPHASAPESEPAQAEEATVSVPEDENKTAPAPAAANGETPVSAGPDSAAVSGEENAPAPPPAAAGTHILRHVLVAANGQRFAIEGGEVTVGRAGLAAEYLLRFPDVSREHCVIKPSRSGVFAVLEDKSKFGTWVNGVQMPSHSRLPISDGAELRFAKRAVFIYKIEEETDQ